MHCRFMSGLVHGSAEFYAHNVCIIPLYNRFCTSKKAKLIPSGFNGDTCTIDPDLPIYRQQWIEHNANSLKNAFQLVNFVKVNGGSLSLSTAEWMNLDLFMLEAVKSAANEVAEQMNKEQREAQTKLEQKMEASKDYRSPFEGAPKPTFIP